MRGGAAASGLRLALTLACIALGVALAGGVHTVHSSALAEIDPQQSRIIELRYFGGLTIEETAEVMKLSPATIKREWAMARAWLHQALTKGDINQTQLSESI